MVDIIKKGISVIVCCYNSSWVIEETLHHLFSQKIDNNIPWEIILVNNASTDTTNDIVEKIFAENKDSYSCKLVYEPTPGLSYARDKGIRESKYEYILYCDDDNFLSENYFQEVYRIMESDENIGACGGTGTALIRDYEAPHWFMKYKKSYAIGSQEGTDIIMLYGAGICIRKSAFLKLKEKGFKYFLTGRKGDVLLAGEDTELTTSLRIIGYKLYASDQLQFQHLIPEKRLTVDYLVKMYYGFGYVVPILLNYVKTAQKTSKKNSIKTYLKNDSTIALKLIFMYLVKYPFVNKIDRQVNSNYLKGFLKAISELRLEIKECQAILKKISK